MSTPNPKDILVSVPGRLCINPTGFGGVFPYGGTALGIAKSIALRPGHGYEEVTAEEFGGERVEVVAAGESWVLAVVLRSWDHDGLSRVFPSEAVGASGKPLVTHPSLVANTGRAGRLLGGSSIVVCFAPDSPAHHPGVVLHKAVALLDESAEANLSLARPQELIVVFRALRNAAGKAISWGILSDMTL